MPRHRASKPIRLWVPSQNGLLPEFPHLHSTARSIRSSARPVPELASTKGGAFTALNEEVVWLGVSS